MLLKDVLDVASYIIGDKKSLKVLSVFQAVIAYYIILQAIFVFKPLLSSCERYDCAILIYGMGFLVFVLFYLLLRERAKPNKKDSKPPDEIIKEYLSSVSWKELMGTNTITPEVMEKVSLEISDLLVNRVNEMSVSKAIYKMLGSILNPIRVLSSLFVYALLLALEHLWKDTAITIIHPILEPSFRNLGTGIVVYILLTLLITSTTGLLSPLMKALNVASDKVHSNAVVKYIFTIIAATLFPYFSLDWILRPPNKPEVRTFSLLYKINTGDPPDKNPPNPEFTHFVQILFDSKDNEGSRYAVFSPLTGNKVSRKHFENALIYQFQNAISTTPGIMSSVYLLYKRPETVSLAIFTIETELKYDLKRIRKKTSKRGYDKLMEETVITDPKQVYVLKIIEVSSESVIQDILIQMGEEIFEGKFHKRRKA